MSAIEGLDHEDLLRLARESELKESFIILKRDEYYRIGVGIRIHENNTYLYFIELTIKLASPDENVDLDWYSNLYEVLEHLSKAGYSVLFQEGGYILCEIESTKFTVNNDYAQLCLSLEELVEKK